MCLEPACCLSCACLYSIPEASGAAYALWEESACACGTTMGEGPIWADIQSSTWLLLVPVVLQPMHVHTISLDMHVSASAAWPLMSRACRATGVYRVVCQFAGCRGGSASCQALSVAGWTSAVHAQFGVVAAGYGEQESLLMLLQVQQHCCNILSSCRELWLFASCTCMAPC